MGECEDELYEASSASEEDEEMRKAREMEEDL